MVLKSWFLIVICILIFSSVVVALYDISYNARWSNKNSSIPMLIIAIICVFLSVSSMLILIDYLPLYNRYTHVGSIGQFMTSKKYSPSEDDNSELDYIRFVYKSSLTGLNLKLDEYKKFDRVCFTVKNQRYSLSDFLRGYFNKSIWLDVSVEETTEFILIKGSDFNVMVGNKSLIGSKRGYSYLKYDGKLFKIGKQGGLDWLKEDATYIISYDSKGISSIYDSDVEYDCYDFCSVQEYIEN